jgi:hypothetical protein
MIMFEAERKWSLIDAHAGDLTCPTDTTSYAGKDWKLEIRSRFAKTPTSDAVT